MGASYILTNDSGIRLLSRYKGGTVVASKRSLALSGTSTCDAMLAERTVGQCDPLFVNRCHALDDTEEQNDGLGKVQPGSKLQKTVCGMKLIQSVSTVHTRMFIEVSDCQKELIMYQDKSQAGISLCCIKSGWGTNCEARGSTRPSVVIMLTVEHIETV